MIKLQSPRESNVAAAFRACLPKEYPVPTFIFASVVAVADFYATNYPAETP